MQHDCDSYQCQTISDRVENCRDMFVCEKTKVFWLYGIKQGVTGCVYVFVWDYSTEPGSYFHFRIVL